MDGVPTMRPMRMAGGYIPQQEYLLQGSVLDSHCKMLLHRLRGLSDNADSHTEQFRDREMVFLIRQASGTPIQLRVRQSLDQPHMPFHLRYLGTAETSDKARATLVRSTIDINCSHNIVQFLTELGFRLDYEYILTGYIFRKGRMKVIVAKVFSTEAANNEMKPLSESYLVEMSVVAPTGQETIADEMKAFAEQLKPLVTLEKIDMRRLQSFLGSN